MRGLPDVSFILLDEADFFPPGQQQDARDVLDVAITLGLKSEEALRYHQEYFMLLGSTEFTKVYLQIKDNSCVYGHYYL